MKPIGLLCAAGIPLLIACNPLLRGDALTSATSSFIERGSSPIPRSAIAHSAIELQGTGVYRNPYICSGVVLSPTVVLTAAHCVVEEMRDHTQKLIPTEWLHAFNDFSFFSRSIDVVRTLVPPQYLKAAEFPDYGYDIALVELKEPLPSDYIPAELERDLEFALTQPLHTAGFGAQTGDSTISDENVANDLAAGDIVIDSKVDSEESWSRAPVNRAYSNLLKFRSRPGGAALCLGDSGGPVYYEKNGKIRVIGVNNSIEFHDSWSASRRRCATDLDEEMASSVFAENAHFIAEGFQQLTGQPLTGSIGLPKDRDPSVAEYYLDSRNPAPDSNQWIHLSDYSAFLLNQRILLMPTKETRSRCELKTNDALIDTDPVGPSSTEAFAITLRDQNFDKSEPKAVYRGKAILRENQLLITLSTPSGFVRASLPLVNCGIPGGMK
jgi:hypothetical protein